nr:hypothetical protein [Tanacetum cinerariifolium]
VLRGDAWPVVLNAQHHVTIGCRGQRHQERPLLAVHSGHGLHGVHQQIDDHLLQLHLVTLDPHRLAGGREIEVDAMPQHLPAHQRDRLQQDILQVDPDMFGISLARQRTDAPNDLAGA